MEGLTLSINKPQEHLIKGEKPIFVCVGSRKDFHKQFPTPPGLFYRLFRNVPKVHDVNYFDRPKKMDKEFFLHGDYLSHVISVLDGLDKYSNNFQHCTGLVVVGRDRLSNENISFITHQDIEQSSGGDVQEKFVSNLRVRLNEIRTRCIPGSFDAVIVGGVDFWGESKSYFYIDKITLLDKEVEECLEFKPTIINGPKGKKWEHDYDSIYFDTKNRRLFLMRPEVNQNQPDFTLSRNS